MSRDENGNFQFTLQGMGIILGLLLSLVSVGGVVGSYYVQAYRLGEAETAQRDLRNRFAANEVHDGAQDVELAKIGGKLDNILEAIRDIKQADHPTQSGHR